MLRDEMLVEGTCKLIRTHLNAEWALQKVLRSIKQVFDNDDGHERSALTSLATDCFVIC